MLGLFPWPALHTHLSPPWDISSVWSKTTFLWTTIPFDYLPFCLRLRWHLTLATSSLFSPSDCQNRHSYIQGRKKCSLLCSWTSLLSQCTLGWEYFIYAGLKFHLKVSIVPERRLSEATSAPLLTLTSIKRVLHFVPIVILIVIVSSSTRRDLCGFVNGSVGKKCFQQFLGHWRQERRWTTLHSHSCSQTMLPAPVSLSLPVLSAPYLGVEVTHTIMISPLGVWSKTP